MRARDAVRYILSLSCVFCMLVICVDIASARPIRWHRRHRTAPVVVKPKVVVTPKKRVVVVSESWPSGTVTQEAISPEEIAKRRIKAEYGLIDFEVYPYDTKIYIDSSYKGYARTLNKDKNSLKVRKGTHVVELRKANMPVKVVNIVVDAGHKTIIEQQ